MAIDLSFGGSVDAFGRALAATQKEFMALSVDESDAIMKEAFDRSQELVPVKTGNLKSTGKIVRGRTRKTDQHLIKIRYGHKKTAPYAGVVHDDPTDKHEHGQHKYLRNAVEEKTANLPQRIGARLKRR